MSTIVIGVDASERSEDAIAFGGTLAEATHADVILATAFPYSDRLHRAAGTAHRRALRDDALSMAQTLRDRLLPSAHIRLAANLSPAHALHDLAGHERAALLVVGSTHTGPAGRVLPGSTGERLLHGAPCPVAVVPKDYRTRAGRQIRTIGVAYDATPEAAAAVAGAAALARELDAALEVIAVACIEPALTAAAMAGALTLDTLQDNIERATFEGLEEIIAGLPAGGTTRAIRRTGSAAEELTAQSHELDLLILGSRGYGPLRSVLVGGVSGRVMRSAACPVIVAPRGVEAPLGALATPTGAPP